MNKLLTCLTLIFSFYSVSQTSWYQIATTTDKKLNTICFASPSVGYIGGNDSLLLKSVDGGKTWSEVNYTGVTFYPGGEHLINMKFVTESIGYLTTGPYGGTYKTTDGGSTWTAITFVGVMCYNQALYFWDEDNGIFGGSGCFQGEHMEYLSSGTLTESTINTPSWLASDYIRDIDFLNSTFGIAVSERRFLRTTDGGVTWDTIPSGTPNPLTSIEVINDTLAFAGYVDLSSSFGILKTTDGGLTWTEDIGMATFYYPDYHDVIETQSGYIYAVGASDQPGSTGLAFDDKGSGWVYYPLDQPLRSLATYGDSTVFAVGDSGYVVTNVDPANLDIGKSEEIQTGLVLYPNPASEVIYFSVDGFDKGQILEISILDVSGREVFAAAQTENIINVANLTEGMYVLVINMEGQILKRKFLKD